MDLEQFKPAARVTLAALPKAHPARLAGAAKIKGPCALSRDDAAIRRRYDMATVSMMVNGNPVSGDIDPRTLLVQFIRDHQRLTGTHVGCDTSQCGACVVHIDGKAVKSCTILAVQCQGASVVTIEGIAAPDGTLHPMQEAFREHHGLQCGFCTPGMIMSAIDIVNRKGNDLDEHTIREELEGNICRCTGYHNIVRAVDAGARAMAGASLRQAAE
jgi:carbon-monoxide dehydrogenase small subunit